MCALINILNIPVHVTSLAKVFIQSVENRVLLTLGLHRWTCTSYVYGINLSNEGKNDKTLCQYKQNFIIIAKNVISLRQKSEEGMWLEIERL